MKAQIIEKERRFYKECEIVMLETNTPSKILKSSNSELFIPIINLELDPEMLDKYIRAGSKPHHLYITSDDEIEVGDWYIIEFNGLKLTQCTSKEELISLDGRVDCRKIIASTDISLEIPQPSDKFIQAYIEAYNKGENIEKVLVEHELFDQFGNHIMGDIQRDGDTVKPKLKDNNIIIKKVKDSWTREEVIDLLHSAGKYGRETASNSIAEMPDVMDKWIEENL